MEIGQDASQGEWNRETPAEGFGLKDAEGWSIFRGASNQPVKLLKIPGPVALSRFGVAV